MSAPHATPQENRQPGAPPGAPLVPLAHVSKPTATLTPTATNPALNAQAPGMASKENVGMLLESATMAATRAGPQAVDGIIQPKHSFLLSTALKALYETGAKNTLRYTRAMLGGPPSPLGCSFNETTGAFGPATPATDEMQEAFTGLANADLILIHEALQLDKAAITTSLGAHSETPSDAAHTQQATNATPAHFAPSVASPLHPALLQGAAPYTPHVAYVAQTGTTLLPTGLDATAARALGGETGADMLALYLASAGVAPAGHSAGGGGGAGAGRAEAGLAPLSGGGGELPNAATHKAPLLSTFLLDKKDNTTQLVLENGRVTAKKEASDTHMSQTQFMNAYMALIQTSYAHCAGPAMRFFMHLNNLWDKYPHAALMRYERAVRQKCTRYPDTQLDDIAAHTHEFLEHVVSAVAGNSHAHATRYAPKQDEPANKRGRAASPARGGGAASGSGHRSPPAPPKGKKPPCIQYNGKEGCTRGAKCGYPHTCTRCQTFIPAGAKDANDKLITRCTRCTTD